MFSLVVSFLVSFFCYDLAVGWGPVVLSFGFSFWVGLFFFLRFRCDSDRLGVVVCCVFLCFVGSFRSRCVVWFFGRLWCLFVFGGFSGSSFVVFLWGVFLFFF